MVCTLPMPVLGLRRFEDVPAWTDEGLFEACGVRIAFTGRDGGTSAPPYDSLNLGRYVDDDLSVVEANLAHALSALGAGDAPCIVPKQVHGVHVETVAAKGDVEAVQARAEQGADAVVVATEGVAAQLSFADCLPLVVVSPSGHFAVVHAGWRGALAGVAGEAVRALAAQDCATGLAPSGFNVYIGPYIHEECFETGQDVVEQFIERYGSCVLGPSGHVSLAQAVGVDLERAGVDKKRIADIGVCTVCQADAYYSYRATGGVCGRQGALAFAQEKEA